MTEDPITLAVFPNLSTPAGKTLTIWPGDLSAAHSASFSEPKTSWSDPGYAGCFFTLSEGLQPGTRISSSNPVAVLRGVAADYDDPRLTSMSDAEVTQALDKVWAKHPHLKPYAWSRSLSRKVHVIWVFEAPITLPLEQPFSPMAPSICESFLKSLKKLLKAEAFPFGLDITVWENTSIRFHIGTDWTRYGESLSSELILSAYSGAVESVCSKHLGTVLPLPKVHALCLEKFPDTCPPAPFTDGARVPCFWITDGSKSQDSSDAIIRTTGITIFSDKARASSNNKPFLFWTDPLLLGSGAVESSALAFREELKDQFICVGETWGIIMPDKLTGTSRLDASQSRKSLFERLNELGMPGSPEKPESPAFKFYRALKQDRTVSGYADTFWGPPRMYKSPDDGNHYYSKRATPLLEPLPEGSPSSPETWPIFSKWLDRYFMNGTDENGNTPRDYLLRWLQHAYTSALKNPLSPAPGHCLYLVGPPAAGKSWFLRAILGNIFGESAVANDFVTGRNSYSGTLYSRYLWAVGDPPGKVGCSVIKEIVAEGRLQVNMKYGAQFDRKWTGRVVVTLNDGAQIRESLPTAEDGMLDKFMVFRLRSSEDDTSPWLEKEGGFDVPAETFVAECRALCRWLLDHKFSPDLQGYGHRYGLATPWCDQDLLNEVHEVGPEASLAHAVATVAREAAGTVTTQECVFDPDSQVLRITAEGLRQLLHNHGGYADILGRGRGVLPRGLSDLARNETYPWITKPPKASLRYYSIDIDKLPKGLLSLSSGQP